MIGRWPPRWPSPSYCCWPVPSQSISTITSSSSRSEAHGNALLPDVADHIVSGHCDALPADHGAHRLLVQRLTAGQCLGRVLNRLVLPIAAQSPAAAGGASVAGSGGHRL